MVVPAVGVAMAIAVTVAVSVAVTVAVFIAAGGFQCSSWHRKVEDISRRLSRGDGDLYAHAARQTHFTLVAGFFAGWHGKLQHARLTLRLAQNFLLFFQSCFLFFTVIRVHERRRDFQGNHVTGFLAFRNCDADRNTSGQTEFTFVTFAFPDWNTEVERYHRSARRHTAWRGHNIVLVRAQFELLNFSQHSTLLRHLVAMLDF
mmetsp:Transcript_7660/g.11141  ORF Transcript_7660/g.11141 Transcript_7660/m.11141 type:complete len:203 (+) Transcript_7660:598-1206(+)